MPAGVVEVEKVVEVYWQIVKIVRGKPPSTGRPRIGYWTFTQSAGSRIELASFSGPASSWRLGIRSNRERNSSTSVAGTPLAVRRTRV